MEDVSIVDGVAYISKVIEHTTQKGKHCWKAFLDGEQWWIWEEALAMTIVPGERHEYIGTINQGFKTLNWAAVEGSVQPAETEIGYFEAKRKVDEMWKLGSNLWDKQKHL